MISQPVVIARGGANALSSTEKTGDTGVMDVLKWALEADIGARVVYHRERVRGKISPLGTVGATALADHEAGLVFLAQRRVDGFFQYEARRISTPCARALRLVTRTAS